MSTPSVDIELNESLQQSTVTWPLIRRLAGYYRPYALKFCSALGMELFWVLALQATTWVAGLAIDEGIRKSRLTVVAWCAVAILLLRVVVWLLAWVELKWTREAGEKMLGDLRRHVFRHVQAMSMSYFDRNKAGQIIARADRDVDALEFPFMWGPLIYVSCIFSMTVSAAFMLWYNWRMFAAVIWVIVPMLVATKLFRVVGMKAYRRVRYALSNLTAEFAENISGVRVVQAFGREKAHSRKFRGTVKDYNVKVFKSGLVWASYMPSFSLLYGVALIIALFMGGREVVAGRMQPGQFVAFMMFLGAFFHPIDFLGELYNDTLSGSAALERIFKLLDTPADIQDREGARRMPVIKGHIRFDNVSFSYGSETAGSEQTDDPWVLREVSFEVEPGQTVALVGQTGAGKTTITSLIARFYEPTSGTVSIDGVDLREVTLESLHRQMGIVLQENFLFSGTVMENLTFGRPEATDEEVIRAATALGCHDIIMELPEGYQTEVRERGGRLSQGQRQLICFTRAMVADPRILMLDEATSAVDARTEARIHDALVRLIKNRTTVVVAHRLSTIRHADKILVIEGGRIVERGNHAELVARGGRYARMYADYLQDDEG